MFRIFCAISSLLILFLPAANSQVALRQGMTITQSTTVKPGTYQMASDDLETPVITISGEDITVDFGDATLDGNRAGQMPNEFTGLGILVKDGKNITIKNLHARGFKIALLAENVDDLQIESSDFSYNYRMRLYSIRERENFQDWLSYHNNESDEWFRYGAGIYLKNCDRALVKNVHITQNQNALLMTGCDDGLFYNNTFRFNSGLGIGMYRSSRNRIMHNNLNFSIRGHSEGFYNRGQDSAGILIYEQSNDNIFAYNTATHSGDGFFLWAGNETMDSGEGGCNGNILYKNDFSYAPTNGIEVTFSSNIIVSNRLVGCRYGIWGGYSWKTWMFNNFIKDNDYGIAIEHGQENVIRDNVFINNDIGIQLWQRPTQPTGWGYAEKRDVRSRDYEIGRNIFHKNTVPLEISGSSQIAINDDNAFHNFEQLLVAKTPNEAVTFVKNDIYQNEGWQDAELFRALNRTQAATKFDPNELPGDVPELLSNLNVELPRPLPDGNAVWSQPNRRIGRHHMRINEWGPYNYEYPEIWLERIDEDRYTFALLGPAGDWQVKSSTGFSHVTIQEHMLFAEKQKNADYLVLDMEYTGPSFTNQFGEVIPADQPVTIRFDRYEREFDWKVEWHAYDETTDPMTDYAAFKNLRKQKPLHREKSEGLKYVWWRAPHEDVPADQFATFAQTTFKIPEGKYRIILTSDDGVKLFLDGKLIVDRWNAHESTVDDIEVALGGKHVLEIEHFDASGLANLDFRIEPVK
jgi:parallel beta-helix repeat protein